MNVVTTFGMHMYASQQRSLLEDAFGRLLNVELDGSRMNAVSMEQFAAQVAASVSDRYNGLSAALGPSERENIRTIAQENGTGTRAATVEYIANAYLFRSIRDYFDLPAMDIFPRFDLGGFLVFTWNGSLVASPPEDLPGERRTLHYTRMPSRARVMESNTLKGDLKEDIRPGHRLKSTAFKTSAVQRLLYLPAGRASLFAVIHETATLVSTSMSRILTRQP